MADAAAIAALHAEVAGYHLTDRAMLKAQARMGEVLAKGPPADDEARRYLAAVERYFGGFEREARAHLADLERRLAKAAQIQFNLTAERGVAAKRVEITQGVLATVRELARG